MIQAILFVFLFFCACGAYAQKLPWYIGAQFGYGSSTWGKLVPVYDVDVMEQTVPRSVKEEGFSSGVAVGYEFNRHFTLEGNYIHYPKAIIKFSPDSKFAFDHNKTRFSTHSESFSVMAKFMANVPYTSHRWRVFSSFGVGALYRHDMLRHMWHFGPGFGAGAIWDISKRLLGELGFQLYAGDAKSEFEPVKDYIPFLYTAYGKISYRFSI